MSEDKKRTNIRLDVTKEERDRIRVAAALAGYSSMADFSRAVVLQVANLFQPRMAVSQAQKPWFDRLPPQRRAWLVKQLTQDESTAE
jgi:hypothetical protein